jgi:alkylated DNA repair protein (DNA oxidative demethylase)
MSTSLPSARSRLRTSRLGGVATAAPGPGAMRPGQLALGLGLDPPGLDSAGDASSVAARTSHPLADVVHVRHWLSPDAQRSLIEQFREWASPPAGLRHPRVPTGHLMSVQSVCLGWHWQPYTYSRTADDLDGAPVKPMPAELFDLARRGVDDTVATHEAFVPDAAIVNYYAPDARLGLHQDGEEPSDAPVVTISLGDTCIFRMAGVDRRTGPFTDVRLESGDLLVFGGRHRRIFHGVPKVLDERTHPALDLPPGRVSITVRETGLA